MASKQKTDQTVRMATSEQLKQLIAIIVQAIPTRITWAQAQHWIGHAKELAAKIRAIFAVADPHHDQLAAWQKFYAELGITIDLSGLHVPPTRDGFTRLIVVAAGVTIEQVLAACAKRFPVRRFTNDDLDKLTTSERNPALTYAIWVRPRIEADDEHANRSYNDLKKMDIKGITLLERLVQELFTEITTGGHLDIQNVTLCSGSLCRGWVDQDVPDVSWSGGELDVDWCDRDGAGGFLRSREVVVG